MDKTLSSEAGSTRALLEVLFWNQAAGFTESELSEKLGMELTVIQQYLRQWQEALESVDRGLSLHKKGDHWILYPKKEYANCVALAVKRKRIPLDQREIIALLFYEGGMTKEAINEKRGKSSGGAIQKLEKEGLIEAQEAVYTLTQRCRDAFEFKGN